MPDAVDKIVIVTRKTRLEVLLERFNTLTQAQFYLERAGADFVEIREEHGRYQAAIALVRRECRAIAPRLHVIDRSYLPTYLFAPRDLVVVIGPDGLVVNAAKYLDGQPIVAVNPDPGRFDGILLPYAPEGAAAAASRVIEGHEGTRAVTMAEVRLSDGQRLLAFNDFFVGPRSHTSARYVIRHRAHAETQSSSGVIVSTGAGSTGWMSSVFNMAAGLMPALGVDGPVHPEPTLPWEADRLRFAVREPFRSRASQAELVYGEIEAGEVLALESLMPEEGVIFSDGIEADFLRFNAGTTATIGVSARKARLAVPVRAKKRKALV